MSSELSASVRRSEQNVRRCFKDFCKQTILHGWHYLAERDLQSGSPEREYPERGPTTGKEEEEHDGQMASPIT